MEELVGFFRNIAHGPRVEAVYVFETATKGNVTSVPNTASKKYVASVHTEIVNMFGKEQ